MEEDFWTPHGQQGLAEGSVSFMFLSFWAVRFVTRNKNYLQLVFSQKKKKSTWRVFYSHCKRKMRHLLLLKMY